MTRQQGETRKWPPVAVFFLLLIAAASRSSASPSTDEPAPDAAADASAKSGEEHAGKPRSEDGYQDKNYTLASGEEHKGDLYVFNAAEIAGIQHGDVTFAGFTLNITGVVDGDVFAAGQTVNLGGKIGDSVRAVGRTVTITGSIDGDLLVWAEELNITSGAHITKKVAVFCARVVHNGVVDGDFTVKGGEATINGTIGGNADVTCDKLNVSPKARIGGDFAYKAREPISLEGKGIVGGQVSYEKPKADDKGRKSMFSGGRIAWKVFLLVASLIVGCIAFLLFRDSSLAAVQTIGRDPLKSAGIGFITTIVVPVAAALSCILIITIPLVILIFLLYLFALYIAKVPVAAWLGRAILQKLRRKDPSLFTSLLLGLAILYFVFLFPWYIKWPVYLGCLFCGLGAIVLGMREAYNRRHGAPAYAGSGPSAPIGPSAPPKPPVDTITFGSEP